jgi:hypothetical protein
VNGPIAAISIVSIESRDEQGKPAFRMPPIHSDIIRPPERMLPTKFALAGLMIV